MIAARRENRRHAKSMVVTPMTLESATWSARSTLSPSIPKAWIDLEMSHG